MRIVPQSVKLEFITPTPTQPIEVAGRTCYKSEDKITLESAAKFIDMLYERGHESVIEHPYASFRVVCDRGVSHEFVRHRLFSYSQESTRYCNYGKDKFGNEITVIEPPGLTIPQRRSWEHIMRQSELAYLAMLADHARPEIARSVLPTCLKTELVAIANFREWCHFLRLRTSPKAHPQMQEVANMIGKILLRECPEVFKHVVSYPPQEL